MGCRVWGLGFSVEGLGCSVEGLGYPEVVAEAAVLVDFEEQRHLVVCLVQRRPVEREPGEDLVLERRPTVVSCVARVADASADLALDTLSVSEAVVRTRLQQLHLPRVISQYHCIRPAVMLFSLRIAAPKVNIPEESIGAENKP